MKWVEKNSNVVGYGRDIIFAENKYYMISKSPAKVCVSEDLINWTEYLLNDNYIQPEHIAYGNGKFLIVGLCGTDEKSYYYYSNDGVNWIPKVFNNDSRRDVPFVKFINNKFVFGFFVTGYYATSGIKFSKFYLYETTDGINIKNYTFEISEANQILNDLSYNNGLYVGVGKNGIIYTSANLSTWEKKFSNISTDLTGINYGKGIFVAVGSNGVILTSKDGISWFKQNSGTSSYLEQSRYANGMYVAVGYNGTVLSSINGTDWNREKCPNSGVRFGLVFANNKIVITGSYYSATHKIPLFYAEIYREISYSNDNSLYVYDKNLNFLGVIDDFISLRWRRKYYEAGEADLVVAPLENNIRLLKVDNIIIRKNYVEAMIIDTKIFIDDGYNVEIKVSGKFLSYLLYRRIIKNRINYSGNYIDGSKYLLQNMTPLCQNFEIEPTSLNSDEVTFQCSYKNVYEQQVKMAKKSKIGFRIVPNVENKTYIYENYKGLDRTRNQSVNERYCFCKKNYTIQKPRILETNIDKCNYVLIGGEGEDSNRILTEITTDLEGLDLFEKFVDAKSERKDNLNDSDYLNVLKEKGKEKIKGETKNIEFVGLSTDYKSKWDLGDLVDIEIDENNIYENQRIVEIEETINSGDVHIYPVFGDPLEENLNDD